MVIAPLFYKDKVIVLAQHLPSNAGGTQKFSDLLNIAVFTGPSLQVGAVVTNDRCII